MILHGATPSPFYRKVVVVLEEKGVPYSTKNTAPFPKTPELLERHPLGKIPFLEVDGTFIADSSVICDYIDRAHPEKPMVPADPKQAARALWLEEYADTKFNEAVGGIFFERFVKPNVFKQDTDEKQVQNLVENALPEPLDYLESQVPDEGWLVGEFSIADATVGNLLGSLQFARVELDGKRWPKLAAYQKRLFARPSFQKALSFS